MILFSFFICIIGGKLVDANQVSHGFQLEGQTLRRMWNLSLKQCHDECMLRNTCKSYNYIRSVLLCELNKADKVDEPDHFFPFTQSTYGQKLDWDTPVARPECSSCGDHEICEGLENGTFNCFVRECQNPPPAYNGTISFGNLNWIGAKVRYVCTGGTVRIGNPVSQCISNGSWSIPTFKCIPGECWTPSMDPMYKMDTITTDSTSALMHFRCIGNNITRGSPLRCGDDGLYNFDYACCDIPDQESWTTIYRIKTAGKHGALALWEVENYGNSADGNTEEDCQFRRFDIIKNWSNLHILKVKIQMKDGDTVMASITFDGNGSTSLDWLSQGRLLEAPWSDLSTSTDIQLFSAEGSFDDIEQTRFSIMESISVNCTQISGWMMVVVKHPCIDAQNFPTVMYAPGLSKAITIDNFEIADTMEIMVEFGN